MFFRTYSIKQHFGHCITDYSGCFQRKTCFLFNYLLSCITYKLIIFSYLLIEKNTADSEQNKS